MNEKKNFACGDEVLRQANLNIQSSYCLAMFIGREILKSEQEGPKTYWDNWDYAEWRKGKKSC